MKTTETSHGPRPLTDAELQQVQGGLAFTKATWVQENPALNPPQIYPTGTLGQRPQQHFEIIAPGR